MADGQDGERRRRACLAWAMATPETHSGWRPELGQDPSTSQASRPNSREGQARDRSPTSPFSPQRETPSLRGCGTDQNKELTWATEMGAGRPPGSRR